jgi:hypothetical protein|tara:strand:+ start:5856 stop:6068 length:213 start_codon:yes stop_codon:yes gene_type:complete
MKSPKKKKLTKLEKAEITAQSMVENEEAVKLDEKSRQLRQYVEYKMMKGYTEEEATRMGNLLIGDQRNND